MMSAWDSEREATGGMLRLPWLRLIQVEEGRWGPVEEFDGGGSAPTGNLARHTWR